MLETKEKPNKIGILVVNYNNLEYTKNCVSDLFKQINQNFELWVVDQNSSEIGTKEYLNELKQTNVSVIENNTNQDLNRVWNWFYENCESEYLCFLNNDVRISNNFTDDTINIFEKESQVGAVIHVTNNSKYVKAEHKLNYAILNPPLYQGWDFCFRRKAYTEIPDTLRIFGGDDFLFGNLNKNGYKTALVYSSPIIHYKEKTRNNIGDVIHEIQRKDNANYHIERQKIGFRHTDTTMGKMSNKYPPQGIQLTQNKNCLFTTLIDDYDILNEVNKIEGWDYLYFTNNINLKSKTWKVIYHPHETKEKLDSYKLSRYYKTNYKKYLSSYDKLIYCDARMKVVGNINELLKRLDGVDISFMKHPHANNIKEEMKRVSVGGLERKGVVDKIKERYEKENYKYDNGLFAGGVLIFKNNERTSNFFNEWWYEIENYSYRDQLSLNFVVSRNPELKYDTQPFYNTINKYFQQTPRKTKRLTF